MRLALYFVPQSSGIPAAELRITEQSPRIISAHSHAISDTAPPHQLRAHRFSPVAARATPLDFRVTARQRDAMRRERALGILAAAKFFTQRLLPQAAV
jgi:hypothetical protein